MSVGLEPQWTAVMVRMEGRKQQRLLEITGSGLAVLLVLKDKATAADFTGILTLISGLDSTDCTPILLVSSPSPCWSHFVSFPRPPSLPLYWTSTVWESPARVYILRGKEVLHRLSVLPPDLKPYLKRTVCTLGQLASKIAVGDTEEVMAAYCEVSGREVEMGERAVAEVLVLLGRKLGVDLRTAGEWFHSYRNPAGGEDILHPHSVTFKQFAHRLRSFCEFSSPKLSPTSCLSHDSQYQASLWQSRLKALESLVQSLRSELDSKENTIVRLQDDLKRGKNGSEQGSNSYTCSPITRQESFASRVESGEYAGQPEASMFMMMRPHAGMPKKSPSGKLAKTGAAKAKQVRKLLPVP